MESVSISLPTATRDIVRARVESGEYGNASEYIRDLIRRDEERRRQQRIEELLLEGLDSGEPVDLDQALIDSISSRIGKGIRAKRNGRG